MEDFASNPIACNITQSNKVQYIFPITQLINITINRIEKYHPYCSQISYSKKFCYAKMSITNRSFIKKYKHSSSR